MKKIFIYYLLFNTFFLFAQKNIITYNGSGNYIYIERTDLRRYDNGKYTGLVNKEVRSFITTSDYNDGYIYDGNFFVHQETRANSLNLYNGFHDSIPSTFKINDEGVLKMIEDHGYPSFRSFPSYSAKEIKPGDSWQAKAERAVDPLNKGIVTKMPIYVQYVYLKDDYFHDEPVYLLSAQWATRYGMGSGTSYIDWGGDKKLSKATGSHKATIIVSKASGNALVVRDTVDEAFTYTDGNTISFKGTISLFTEYPPSINRDKLLPALKRLAQLTDSDIDELKDKTEKNLKLAKIDDISSKNTETDDSYTKINDKTENDFIDDNISTKSIAKLTDKNNTEIKTGEKSKNKTSETKDSLTDKNNKDNRITLKDNSDDDNSDDTEDSYDDLTEKIAKKEYSDIAQKDNSSDKNLRNKIRNTLENNNNITDYNEDDSTVSASTKESEKNENLKKITVTSTPAGLRLTIQNLQFKADSAELLPGEMENLDKIAEVLKLVPDAQFLIEGHTASTGRAAGEMQLSLERAHTIAKALAKRGINEQNFICKGSGGKKPVADNNTESGRARNRRVEITILE